MINTKQRGSRHGSAPVNSLHFWVTKTGRIARKRLPTPVNSPHFWVINTECDMDESLEIPVNSPHFWVINTFTR